MEVSDSTEKQDLLGCCPELSICEKFLGELNCSICQTYILFCTAKGINFLVIYSPNFFSSLSKPHS